jgi:hypothetical protein
MTPTKTPPAKAHNCDPVGLAEIDERLGVVHGTSRKWRSRNLFPEPDFTVSTYPAWKWETVEAWARETGRLPAS